MGLHISIVDVSFYTFNIDNPSDSAFDCCHFLSALTIHHQIWLNSVLTAWNVLFACLDEMNSIKRTPPQNQQQAQYHHQQAHHQSQMNPTKSKAQLTSILLLQPCSPSNFKPQSKIRKENINEVCKSEIANKDSVSHAVKREAELTTMDADSSTGKTNLILFVVWSWLFLKF